LYRNSEFSFDEDEVVSVSTPETTQPGTPDIKISSPDKLIYVEVKHDSPLGFHWTFPEPARDCLWYTYVRCAAPREGNYRQ
jgi:hypothetical protein